MPAKGPRFTLAEQEKVVERAIQLIKEPVTWTTGKWKCDLYETDDKGNFIHDENGELKQACDLFNRPLSQYCIEGAINQATYDVVGENRAIKLGAYNRHDKVENEGFQGDADGAGTYPTQILGIDELAAARYPDVCEYEEHPAMVLNDHFNDPETKAKGHGVMLGLLQDTLASIKAKRKR